MKRLKLLFTMLLLTMSATVFAQKGTTMELWPNGAPNASSDEKDKAELTVYLPDEKKAMKRKQRVVPSCAVLVADIRIWRWIMKVISGHLSSIVRVLH